MTYGRSIQATMDSVKNKVKVASAEALEQKFDEIAAYTIYVAVPDESVDTGAYVTSFSIGPAGFGGGRSRTSNNKPRNQNPQVKKDEGYSQLTSDIEAIDFKSMLESGNMRFTLRNRAPHSQDVENGESWNRDGYHVFEKIRSKYR
jgi:hypothetical protein